MAYNKNKSQKRRKNKSNKNKIQKRKTIKGGGDFFISKPEPASFSDVPLKSFYTMNRLNEGTDVQHMQQSTRLMGGRKNKTNKKIRKHRKNQRGGGILDSVSRFITSSDSNIVRDSGSLNNLPSETNILAGRGIPSNGPFPVKMDTSSYLV